MSEHTEIISGRQELFRKKKKLSLMLYMYEQAPVTANVRRRMSDKSLLVFAGCGPSYVSLEFACRSVIEKGDSVQQV